MRAANLASVPLRLYRGEPGGDKEPVESHPSTDLLRMVNPHWTRGRLLRMTEWALGLWGEAFWFISRGANGRGMPSEIWWARPDRVSVVPDANDYIAGFIYEINGQRIPFSPDETIWIPMDNPIDEFSGLSPIASGRLGIDTSHAAMLANRQMHVNGMRISGIMSPANPDVTWSADNIEQLGDMFQSLKGANNAHKMAVMSRMAKFDPMTLAPKDAEYLGQLRWSVGVVSRIFSVAPELLGDHERATYTNMDQAYKALWTDAVIPQIRFLCDELTEKYLPMFGRADDLFIEPDISDVSVLQEDQTEITQQASVWIDRGVPLNRVLQEMRPGLLPEGQDGYEWGNVPIWEAKAKVQSIYEPVSTGDANDEPPSVSGQVAGQQDTVGADEPPRGFVEDYLWEHAPSRVITDYINSGWRSLSAMWQKRVLKAWRKTQGLDHPQGALALIAGMIDQRSRQIEIGSPEHHARSRRFNRQVERHEKRFSEALADMFRRQRDSVVTKLQNERHVNTEMQSKLPRATAVRDAFDAESMPFDRAEWEQKFRQMALPFFQAMLSDGAYEALDDIGVTIDFNLDNPLTDRMVA